MSSARSHCFHQAFRWIIGTIYDYHGATLEPSTTPLINATNSGSCDMSLKDGQLTLEEHRQSLARNTQSKAPKLATFVVTL